MEQLEIDFRLTVSCPVCGGDGWITSGPDCPACWGTKSITKTLYDEITIRYCDIDHVIWFDEEGSEWFDEHSSHCCTCGRRLPTRTGKCYDCMCDTAFPDGIPDNLPEDFEFDCSGPNLACIMCGGPLPTVNGKCYDCMDPMEDPGGF